MAVSRLAPNGYEEFRLKLLLYGTEHCSLCERALDLLLSMPEMGAVTLEVVDVATAPALTERYGARLPVLAVGAAELDWPFDAAAVGRALAAARLGSAGTSSPGSAKR